MGRIVKVVRRSLLQAGDPTFNVESNAMMQKVTRRFPEVFIYRVESADQF